MNTPDGRCVFCGRTEGDECRWYLTSDGPPCNKVIEHDDLDNIIAVAFAVLPFLCICAIILAYWWGVR